MSERVAGEADMRQSRLDVDVAGLSDIGCQRTDNEDEFRYVEPVADEEFARKGRLMVVADGMGGHRGGQMASRLAVDAMRTAFLEGAGSDLHELLARGFSRAQEAILARSEEAPEFFGMGTTCTAAIVREQQLMFGHIGDSRLYVLRRGQLMQLTEDHSLVNHLVKTGAITPDQAAVHERRNVLTAALGVRSQDLEAEFSQAPFPLESEDTVLLTSDGLHGVISADQLSKAVDGCNASAACQRLIELAREQGGPDNITVQMLRVRPVASTET